MRRARDAPSRQFHRMKTIFNLSPLKKITPEQNIHQHGNKHKKKEAGDPKAACFIG